MYKEREEKDVELHFVSRALKEEVKFIKEEEKGGEAEDKLGVDEIFTLFHIVKAAAHFMSALDKFLDATIKSREDIFKKRVKNMALTYIPKLFKGVKEAEEKEFSPDMKFVYGVINQAAEKGSGEFVTNLKTAFKEREVKNRVEQILERRDLRKNIRLEYTYEVDVEKMANELEKVDRELIKDEQVSKGKVAEETYNRALNRFEKALPRAEEDIVQMFKAAHLVLVRDVMLMSIVIGNAEATKELGAKWISEHLMPNDPIIKDNTKLTKIEQKLGERAHTIANGLNVIMKKIKDLELKVEVTLDKSIKIAA